MSKIELQGLTKPEALAALFNAAKPQGLGKLQYNPSHRMDSVEAGIVLTQGMYVDYLEGRVIKTDFGKYPDAIDTALYDRDNGKDAGGIAIWRAAGRKNLGDFRGDLNLPPEIGGCTCQRVERPDVHYEYHGFMGGVLYVYREPDIYRACTMCRLMYINRDMGKQSEIRIPVEYIVREVDGFQYFVRRLVSEFVDSLFKENDNDRCKHT